MRVLLDECLLRRLKRELAGHEAKTVPEMGWASKRNGELLALAVGLFDAFVTADRNLSHQQDLSSFGGPRDHVVVATLVPVRQRDLQVHVRRRRIAFEHALLGREAFREVPERFEQPSVQQPAFGVTPIQLECTLEAAPRAIPIPVAEEQDGRQCDLRVGTPEPEYASRRSEAR